MRPDNVNYRIEYMPWTGEKEFPLTPLETWYIMKGYAVRPATPVTVDDLLTMPGELEMSNGYIMLRQR